jgi:hypothetical protein
VVLSDDGARAANAYYWHRAQDLAVLVTEGNFGRFRKSRKSAHSSTASNWPSPGLVNINGWHPDGREEEQSTLWIEFGGVARRPA